jgi:ATP-dependent 26S proteasome regulatory subunit
VIEYDLPDKARIVETLKAKLGAFSDRKIQWVKLATAAQGLSFADITRVCEDAIKDAIIHERTSVTHSEIVHAIADRKSAVTHKNRY